MELDAPERTTAVEYRWYHKASALLGIVFCLEIGIFLMAMPWTPYWDGNFFLSIQPGWRQFWNSSYARGAVTGLGALNVYIAFGEVVRLRRFANDPPA